MRTSKLVARSTTAKRWATTLAVGLVAVLWTATAEAADLRGTVSLEKKSRQPLQGVLVYYLPDDPAARPKVEVPDEPFTVVTVRKEFTPRATIVPVGSTVRFPNQDNIIHNVFSLSGNNRFDLGLYRRGEGKETTFESPGVVKVYCNVHHSMVAYVVVVETPFYTTAGADGRFELTDLPPGSGRLTVWYERSEPLVLDVDLPLAAPLDLELKVDKPRVPKHSNKFGKPYSRRRSGRDYG